MSLTALPEWPCATVTRLAARFGLRLWLVGGAVRDLLLGRPVHDWDYVVEREALTLARAAADALGGAYYTLDGVRGIARVLLRTAEGTRVVLDFAQWRGPTLEADLAARDFTINALALDEQGTLVDPTGGQADLAARRVRATHPETFRADSVRLLRAVRLAAELDFALEPATEALVRRDAPWLALASAERVRDELVRTLVLDGAAAPLARLAALGLLAPVLPELADTQGVRQSLPHRFDVWEHTLRVVDAVEGVFGALADPGRFRARPLVGVATSVWAELACVLSPFGPALQAHLSQPTSQAGTSRALLLKLGALLHDIGKPLTRAEGEDGRVHFYGHEQVGSEMALLRLETLRFTNDEAARVGALVAGHMRLSHLAEAGPVTPRAVHRYFRALGDAGVETILLGLADHLATWGPDLQLERWSRRLQAAEVLLRHYFTRRERTIAPPPLVSGHDIMRELGLGPGPRIGRLLEALAEAQAAGEIETREQAVALAGRLALDNLGEAG